MCSAESSSLDQTLDEILVGPVPVGTNKFLLQADAPDSSKIPINDIIGVTVVLVTCSYKDQEFARVGYYVNNEYIPYDGYSEDIHGPPQQPLDLTKICRTILADKPRVTRFPINWSGTKAETERDTSMEDENISVCSNIIATSDSDSPQNSWISPEKNKYVRSDETNIVSPGISVCDDVDMLTL